MQISHVRHNDISSFPFLPVQMFKTQKVVSGSFQAELVFESSTTSGNIPSQHFVQSAYWYKKVHTSVFEQVFGPASNYCILGLLPSYLERGNSSLVFMVDHLIQQSGHPNSGFFLHDFENLQKTLIQLEAANHPTLLFGVTYALLDFAAKYPMQLRHTRIIETGGMKGRKREMIREELQEELKRNLGANQICSEYGMTEMMSQAYSLGNGRFTCPPWMQVFIRDMNDPQAVLPVGKPGLINVIDLANYFSCAFIATQDIGVKNKDGSFEVLGRADNSDIRGCSLMF